MIMFKKRYHGKRLKPRRISIAVSILLIYLVITPFLIVISIFPAALTAKNTNTPINVKSDEKITYNLKVLSSLVTFDDIYLKISSNPQLLSEVKNEYQPQPTEEELYLELLAQKKATRIQLLEDIVSNISETDMNNYEHIVSAEEDDQQARIGVAAVILNRMLCPAFHNLNTITDVIYAKNQFSPVQDGRIHNPVNEGTKEAIQCALAGEDPTFGSVYFCAIFKDGSTPYIANATPSVRLGNTQFFYSNYQSDLQEKLELLENLRRLGIIE